MPLHISVRSHQNHVLVLKEKPNQEESLSDFSRHEDLRRFSSVCSEEKMKKKKNYLQTNIQFFIKHGGGELMMWTLKSP